MSDIAPPSPTMPFILGLTGSIAMGKSTVAAMFADLGIPIFDADATVREMQGPDGVLLPAIEAAFPGTTGPEGVFRDRLAQQAFANGEALAVLESIVHPAVRGARAEFLSEHCDARLVVFDIPLLFETGSADEVDAICVVSAPEAVQRERALSREGMTEERLGQILEIQMPDAEKRELAGHIIDTGVSLDETRAQVADLVDELSASRAKK